MDPELIKRVLSYHGQQMTKIWDIEKGNKSLQNLDVKGLDYHEYQQRAKELAIQDRSKRVKIHHFIVEKADVLFRPPKTEPNNIITPEEQESVVQIPPLEAFLNISREEKKVQLHKLMKVGDVVICQVVWRTTTGGSSMALKILALDGGKKRDLTQFQLKGFIYPSYMAAAEGSKDGMFLVNDFVRAEIVEVTDSDKVHLGLKGTVANPEVLKHYPLGTIKPDDMPNYLRALDSKAKGRTFEDYFEDSLQSENPEAMAILARRLGLDDYDTPVPRAYTHMIGLGGISPLEMASSLRKAQAAKWAFKSVSDGIKYFKEGLETEAFQCLNKALAIDPTNVEGLVARGALYANRGNFEKAIEDFLAALKENVTHPNAQKYLAETLCAQGKQFEDDKNVDDALTSYQRCLAIVPGHTEAREAIMAIIALKRKQLDRFELVPLPSDDPFESIRQKFVKRSHEPAVDAKPMDSDQSDGEDDTKDRPEKGASGRQDSLSPFSRKMATIDSTYDNPESKSSRPPPPPVVSELPDHGYADFLKDFGSGPPPPKISDFVKSGWKEICLGSDLVPPPPSLNIPFDAAPPPPVLSTPPKIKQEQTKASSLPRISIISQERLKTASPNDVKIKIEASAETVGSGPVILRPLTETPPVTESTLTPPGEPHSVTPPVNLQTPIGVPAAMGAPPSMGLPQPDFGQHYTHQQMPPCSSATPPMMHHPPPFHPDFGGPGPMHQFDPRAPPGFYPTPYGYPEPGMAPGYHYPGHHGGPPSRAHHQVPQTSAASYDDQVRAFLERITPAKPKVGDDHQKSDSKRKLKEEKTKDKRKDKKEKKKRKKKRSRSDSGSTDGSSSDSEGESSKLKKKKGKTSPGREKSPDKPNPESALAGLPDFGDLPDIDDIQSKLSEYYKKIDKKTDKGKEKEMSDKGKEKEKEKEKKKKKKKKRSPSSSSDSDSMSSSEEERKTKRKEKAKEEIAKIDAKLSKKDQRDGKQPKEDLQASTKGDGKPDRKSKAKDEKYDDDSNDDEIAALVQKEKKISAGKILINLNFKKADEEKKASGGSALGSRSVMVGARKPAEPEPEAIRKETEPLREPRKERSRSRSRESRQSEKGIEQPSRAKASAANGKEDSRRRERIRSGSRERNREESRSSRRSRSRDRSRRERSRSRSRRSRDRRSSSRERRRSRSVEEPKKPEASSFGKVQVQGPVVYDHRFGIYRRVEPPVDPLELKPNPPAVRRSRSRSRGRSRSRSRDRRSQSREKFSRSKWSRSRSRSRSRSPRNHQRGGYRGKNFVPYFARGGRARGGNSRSRNSGQRKSRSRSPPRRRSRSRSRERRHTKPEDKRGEVREYPEESRRPEATIPKGDPPKHKDSGVDMFAPVSAFLSEDDQYNKIEELLRKNRAAKKEEALIKNKDFFRP